MAQWQKLVLIGLALGCFTSCGNHKKDKTPFEIGYENLPLLPQTHHPGLQEELARLTNERATPALLAETENRNKSPVKDEENLAKALKKACNLKMLDVLNQQANTLFPSGEFRFFPYQMKKVSAFRREHDRTQQKFREALALPHCDFGLKPTNGWSANMAFVGALQFSCYLEAFIAAELLQYDQPKEALEPLRLMFQMVDLLAKEKHLVPRLAAEKIRFDALKVLSAIANHRHATQEIHTQLAAIVRLQLANWPSDANAFIEHRALGLITYEWIRDGYFTTLLSKEEIDELVKRFGSIKPLTRAVMDNVDVDEQLFLDAMRRAVESCRLPYYQRIKEFSAIRKKVDLLRNTNEDPFIAINILSIDDLQDNQQRLAADRARCEAWALALAQATGQKQPAYKINPLTGKPYLIENDGKRITIRGISGTLREHPLELKLFPQQPSVSK